MRFLGILFLSTVMAVAAGASMPNFSDARWETVHLAMFGDRGLKVDKLTGEAWYQEKVDREFRWVNIPGPLNSAAKAAMSYGENFQIQSSATTVFLIALRGGDSWRLADNQGRPYWRKIQ